ncbi:MAG: hypothetical protein ACK4KZ_07070 [Aquificaceae bacterium]
MINPKTVYNSPLGNPRKLENILKEKGLYVYETKEGVKGYKDLGLLKWLAYLSFEYIPKTLVFEKPKDPYTLMEQKACMPMASDMPIVLSIWNMDIPSYSFILGNRKNLLYEDFCQEPKGSAFFIPYVGSGRLRAYVYSSRGFSFPGESFRSPAMLSVDFFEKKALVFLLKDGKVYKVYNQSSIREALSEKGIYQVYAYTYQYNLWRFYFGLRFLLCTPAFQAM